MMGKRRLADRPSDPAGVVVIGGSAGSISVLKTIAGSLSADLPAAVLVVVHLDRHSPSVLDEILRRVSDLPCAFARDGEKLAAGHLYIAPPDRHLIVQDGRARVIYGPRQNHTRPAIDPLFHAAADVYGPRAIGVVLSGLLDNGAQGLVAIKERGGTTVVQSPEDAAYPAMPQSALRYAEVDYVAQGSEIAEVLMKLTSNWTPKRAPEKARTLNPVLRSHHSPPETQRLVNTIDPQAETFVLSCPECGGPLTETAEETPRGYRCVVGHDYSVQTLRDLQSDGVERALWTALRTLRESVALRRRMIEQMESRGRDGDRIGELEDEIAAAERDGEVIARLLYGEEDAGT
jgi:two-component system chemotaxis response regulator CheB